MKSKTTQNPKKVIEWKEKIPALEQEYNEALNEAVAYFALPPIITKDSSELEPLKSKYATKLQDATSMDSDIAFSLTKILAPLIEGRYLSRFFMGRCIILTSIIV